MRILVVSDTHGREDNLRRILKEKGTPDMMIHLGDSECGEYGITSLVECPVHMVAGNCDFFTDLPRTKIVELDGWRFLLTHGHYQYVNMGTADLRREARMNGCSAALFGHTHQPYLDQKEPGMTVMNPGSLSKPRQDGKRPSYGEIRIEEGKKPEFEIFYL